MKVIFRDTAPIASRTFGPIDPPKPTPAPYAPRMTEIQQISLPEERLPRVRRVVEAEVGELCAKCLTLYQERFPRLELDAWVSYVRQALVRNDSRVVRTDNAWGMAQAVRTFYEPAPVVVDFGVMKLKTSLSDPVAIYLDFENWARQIGAVEFRFGSMTGADLTPIAKRLGVTREHRSWSKDLV